MELKIEHPELRAALRTVVRSVQNAGGRAVVVGGSVRDALLGVAAKDIDLEVFGIQPSDLLRTVFAHFRVDQVGMAFGVLKLHGIPLDLSIPRRESKAGLGHKGFEVLSDPLLSFEEAASRRDYTINAMGIDAHTGALMDPFHGEADLRARVLRHTSEKFREDPLRVLRGMQLVARFNLTVAPETISICRSMDLEGLARERVYEEWRKLLLQGQSISLGLSFLADTAWIAHFPELAAMIGCQQDPHWHPEGDVWTHTLLCMDAFARSRVGDGHEDLVVGLAVLCHDIGKPLTTIQTDGRIRSPGHDVAGVEPTRTFLARLTNQTSLVEEVIPLVAEHMRPQTLYDTQASPAAIRRLAVRVGRIDRLLRVARADRMGRSPMAEESFPAADWLMKRAEEEDVGQQAPEQIVKGRHLVRLGLQPGPRFKEILHTCYEAQLEGEFSTEAEGFDWISKRLGGG